MRLIFLLLSILILVLLMSWWFNQLFNTPSLVSPEGRVEQQLEQLEDSVSDYNNRLERDQNLTQPSP